MKNKVNITQLYDMEELMPIVARLTEEFTSGESTSVTYERARSLMEAVIYCICHFYENGNKDDVATFHRVSAKEAYQQGYIDVCEKVKKTLEKYNELLGFFCHYGNENYRDTVGKGLHAFFLYYDAKYSPTENIITMDYPILGLDMELTGIDMIAQYIDRVYVEQIFLQKFPKLYVLDELRAFHPRYEKEFFNLKEIIELSLK